jgi:hypothetical protein
MPPQELRAAEKEKDQTIHEKNERLSNLFALKKKQQTILAFKP